MLIQRMMARARAFGGLRTLLVEERRLCVEEEALGSSSSMERESNEMGSR